MNFKCDFLNQCSLKPLHMGPPTYESGSRAFAIQRCPLYRSEAWPLMLTIERLTSDPPPTLFRLGRSAQANASKNLRQFGRTRRLRFNLLRRWGSAHFGRLRRHFLQMFHLDGSPSAPVAFRLSDDLSSEKHRLTRVWIRGAQPLGGPKLGLQP